MVAVGRDIEQNTRASRNDRRARFAQPRGMLIVRPMDLSLLRLLLLLLPLTLAGCDGDADQVPLHLTVVGGDPRTGEQLVESFACGACHVIPNIKGANSHVGPPLDQFGRRSFIGGHVANTPGNLVRWVMDPPSIAPNTAMPSMGITQDQARHIAAYLYTLR